MTAPAGAPCRLGADVPALVWRAAGVGPRPALVYLHGGGLSKDAVGPETVSRVLGRGVSLVAVDLYLHGEHVDEAASALDAGYAAMLEIVRRSAYALVDVVGDLAADAGVRAEAVGVRGDSLGAFVALASLGLGAAFSTAVSVAGAADFERTLAHWLCGEGVTRERVAAEQERLRPLIRELDPVFRVDRIAPRPVLFVHGADDGAVPLAAPRRLFEALVPLYADAPGDCVFVTHAGGHPTPPELDDLAWNWLLDRLAAD